MNNTKIRVLIVDDEYLERNLLRNCIEWEKLNMEIVGEAANAKEAFELTEKFLPEILFTDINMPVTDGIQLSQSMREKHSQIKIVMITGFNDFEYLQKSIRIGIYDYLLKPVDDEEVFKTASKLKTVIEQERAETEKISKLQEQFHDNLQYMRDKFFNELLRGVTPDSVFIDRMAFGGIQFKPEGFQIAAIEPVYIRDRGFDDEKRLSRSLRAIGLMKETFVSNPYVFVFPDLLNRVIILNNDDSIHLFDWRDRLMEILARKMDYTIGIGGRKRSVSEIGISYKEAIDDLNCWTIQVETGEIYSQPSNQISVLTENIKKYIVENYTNGILSLSSLAKTFYLNPSYLSRIFKKETGTSFVEYLTSVRMKQAMRLLTDNELKVFEIAEAVGISDANYFSTCFKKYTGKSVSDYRKSMMLKKR